MILVLVSHQMLLIEQDVTTFRTSKDRILENSQEIANNLNLSPFFAGSVEVEFELDGFWGLMFFTNNLARESDPEKVAPSSADSFMNF